MRFGVKEDIGTFRVNIKLLTSHRDKSFAVEAWEEKGFDSRI